MPVSVSHMTDNGDKQWESVGLVSFQNIEEVVVLKEAHGPVCNLQVKSRDALDQSFKDPRDVWFKLPDFACFEYFNEFGDEHDFLGGISKWPIFE